MAPQQALAALLLLTALVFHCRCELFPTLAAGDEAVMQRCAERINATQHSDDYHDYHEPSLNPCEWGGDFDLQVTCSKTTTPGAARVISLTWYGASGDLTDLGLEELDALQNLSITSAPQFTGGGGSEQVSLTVSSAWATGLTSLQSFQYHLGTLKHFDALFVKDGFPALKQLSIDQVDLSGDYPAGGLPKAVDGAFPVLTQLTITNCGIRAFPSTWGSSNGMLGGLQNLELGSNAYGTKLRVLQCHMTVVLDQRMPEGVAQC
ncbi:hypothetical protein WJX73_005286 [Symbiochloris irregularis]|uniref:Uncharacterized protein n=1 Tax=Symbiochloris irregularis TaxID=706552 RepID=A0AAW1PSD2_9CHLO